MIILTLSGAAFIDCGFEEIILPSIWSANTFVDKSAGPEILEQMYSFKDAKGQLLCLSPEITGIIQELSDQRFFKQSSSPDYTRKIFYISRCWRYETPQAGRQREFTQLGLEIIYTNKDKTQEYLNESVEVLKQVLNKKSTKYKFCAQVTRGLGYYTSKGFEVECDNLGAQKQIAGGGIYSQGLGWAIGLERWLLANE